MNSKGASVSSTKAATGISGLDDILYGGLPEKRLYLLRGMPGTGKTTLALEFLMEGRRLGQSTLYITLSETKDELDAVAESHNWDLSGISFIELSNIQEQLKPESQTTLLHPSEVELNRTMNLLQNEIERLQPRRIVLDSLSELRLIAQHPLRYRRQILALKTFFSTRNSTVIFIDDGTAEATDQQVESIAHGVIELEHLRPDYGAERRRLSIIKLRGVKFRGGYHDYLIQSGGLEVFPRLVASEHRSNFRAGHISSSIPELDKLLGGGLAKGTSTLFLGPAGSGKSSLALQYAVSSAKRGELATIFAFDENVGIVEGKAASLGMDVKALRESGALQLQQVDPTELAPGQFATVVRKRVEEDKAKLVIIDSLNGYMNAMPDERFLLVQLHELLTFLSQRGVTTILVEAQHGLFGSMQSPVDMTYLADSVVLLRYFEFEGAIKKAISVLKKRSGDHEATIRELCFENGKGIQIGPPLVQFKGVLTGVPIFGGNESAMMGNGGAGDLQ